MFCSCTGVGADASVADESLLTTADDQAESSSPRQHDCKGWKLVVCGHSLGAGRGLTAWHQCLTSLSLMLDFRQLMCWTAVK